MVLANILLLISSVIVFFLGLFIFIGNPHRGVNRSFFALLMSAFLWLVANLFTNLSSNPEVALIFARMTIIGTVLAAYSFLLFCKLFTQEISFGLRWNTLLAIPPLLLLVLTPTDLNIVSTEAYGTHTVTGPLYYLLIVVLGAYFGTGLGILVRHYRTTKNATTRAQLRYIFIGMLLTAVPALITNAVMPALMGSVSYLYGPNAVIIFAAFSAIAIVKHRLLDVRLIVARSLAYLMVLTVLTALYGILVFGLAATLIGNNRFSEQILPVIAAVFLAFTLHPLSVFFNRVTNNFFYRDAYDTQAFLDKFNKTLVSTYELNTLLAKCGQIIEENLRPTYCLFGIKETSSSPRRLIGSAGHPDFSEKDIAYIRKRTPKLQQKIIITDMLEARHADMQHVLASNNITLLARLATSNREEGVGYLVLGPKKSGLPYSTQDTRNIEIIANELVIAIQNSLRFEEIENFNATLQARVADATRRLRRTNEKLKALDEAKDDFVSMASHQLRTPLTSVKGYISMVLEGDAGKINATQRKLLEQSFISSQRMVYLIADLLNVSRLKTGKFVIETGSVNLAEVVEQEISQLIETAAGRQLKLTYDKPASFPTMLLDETKTRQVIMNLIDNAIYYTPAGGHIRVELSETPASVEFRVVDDGIGVPKHERPHLFTKFYRAGNARTARPDGTGLGLFMAKKVIVSQGGAIIFESEEGKGSTFGFMFPKSQLMVDVPGQKPVTTSANK